MAGGEQVLDNHPLTAHWQYKIFEGSVCILSDFLWDYTVVDEVGEKGEKEDVANDNLPLEGEALDDGSNLDGSCLEFLPNFVVEFVFVHLAGEGDAKVGRFLHEFDFGFPCVWVLPGAMLVDVVAHNVGDFGCGQNLGLGAVDSEARDGPELVDEVECGEDLVDYEGTSGEVVSEAADGFEVQLFEFKQKGVVYDDEKKGREGAPLFDSAIDVEPYLGPRKRGAGRGFVEEGGDQVEDPLGEPNVSENSQNVVVINAVERLGRVEKKDEGGFLFERLW